MRTDGPHIADGWAARCRRAAVLLPTLFTLLAEYRLFTCRVHDLHLPSVNRIAGTICCIWKFYADTSLNILKCLCTKGEQQVRYVENTSLIPHSHLTYTSLIRTYASCQCFSQNAKANLPLHYIFQSCEWGQKWGIGEVWVRYLGHTSLVKSPLCKGISRNQVRYRI